MKSYSMKTNNKLTSKQTSHISGRVGIIFLKPWRNFCIDLVHKSFCRTNKHNNSIICFSKYFLYGIKRYEGLSRRSWCNHKNRTILINGFNEFPLPRVWIKTKRKNKFKNWDTITKREKSFFLKRTSRCACIEQDFFSVLVQRRTFHRS